MFQCFLKFIVSEWFLRIDRDTEIFPHFLGTSSRSLLLIEFTEVSSPFLSPPSLPGLFSLACSCLALAFLLIFPQPLLLLSICKNEMKSYIDCVVQSNLRTCRLAVILISLLSSATGSYWHIFCLWICLFWDISYKWNCAISCPGGQGSFNYHLVIKSHPWYSMCQ